MEKQNIFFIMVRPYYLGNIGSAARVLKNFGFENLRLVAAPKNYKDAEARKMAVDAFDLLKNAELFPTLAEALKDINVAIGSSTGKQRESRQISLLNQFGAEIAAMSKNKIAIIFGDERNGLYKEELDLCHHVVSIAAAESFPSLNVAQAVAVFAYELARTNMPVLESLPQYSSGAEDDILFEELDTLLHKVEFTRTFNRKPVLSEIRSLYLRARPSAREMGILKGAIRKIEKYIESVN